MSTAPAVAVEPELTRRSLRRRGAKRPTSHSAAALVALALGGFTIGTTEFVTMGLIREIASGVSVSIPTAGHLISAYALGVVVGAPVLAYYGARWPRRQLLLVLLGAYGLFNLLSAVATGYGMLMLARFLDGLPHGAFFGVASLVAASLVEPHRRGRAVALVMMGLSVANVVGVPAATWLGQHLGWRAAFVAVAGLSVLTMAAVVAFVPATSGDASASGRRELAAFAQPQVWLTLLAGATGFGGMFAVFSYAAPTVTVDGGLGDGAVPWVLATFGLGMVAGTWLAGRLADWSVPASMVLGVVGMGVSLVLFWLLVPTGWVVLPAAFLVTALASVLVVNLQLRLMDVAGEAQTLGAAMNHAALNVANALGAWLGGLVIAAGLGYRATALAGALLCAVGLVVITVSLALQRRADLTSTSTSTPTSVPATPRP